MPVIKAHDLSRRLEGDVPVTLVKNASLQIEKGEFVVINGPSGSGKSSLLYLLGLLDSPTSGQIIIDGVDTAGLSDNELADLRLSDIGFVFQFHFLLPEFTALENVMLPMQRQNRLTYKKLKLRAENLLTSLGLQDQQHKLPRQLSGGQSQRVAIARALSNEPALILADEPTGNLDTVSSKQVAAILTELAHSQKKAVVIVSHDPRFAEEADRVITIVDGKIQR